MRSLLLFSFIIFFYLPGAANQQYVFRHLTTADGLSSNFVQHTFQDSKGFYWVSTTSGLQIFDGYSFSKPLKAGNDMLWSAQVFEATDGTMLVFSQYGVYRYKRERHQFIPILASSNSQGSMFTVYQDEKNTIWLTDFYKVYKYDPAHDKALEWIKLPAFNPLLTGGALAFQKGRQLLWIHNDYSLLKVDLQKRTITKEISVLPQVAALWADEDNYLWISNWNEHLCRYNTQTGKKDFYSLVIKNKNIQNLQFGVSICFNRDKTGRLWIGTIDGGLWYLDEKRNRVVQLDSGNERPESFRCHANVYSINNDKENNVWIATDEGINIFNPLQLQFFTLHNSELPSRGLEVEISQLPFETSTGDLLIPTSSAGWHWYDQQLNLKQSFNTFLPKNASQLDSSKIHVTCFAEDRMGRIYVGHPEGILEMYDPHSQIHHYKIIPGLRSCLITDMEIDSTGNIWFALRSFSDQLAMWDPVTDKLTTFHDKRLKQIANQPASILLAKDGNLWMQTFGNGVFCFDTKTHRITEIHRDGEMPYGIPSAIEGISMLNDSILAVASYVKGFFLINTRRKTCELLNMSYGLPSDVAKAIAADSKGNYWIATVSDLLRMDPVTKNMVSFDEEDGVMTRNFIRGFGKLRDKKLILLTSDGLLYFHPDSIKTEAPPPDVVVTGLRISSKPVLLDSLIHQNKLLLDYNQNFLSLDFVSVSFLQRKATTYSYKMEGLGNEWIETGNQRTANFTGLTPGKYTFMVRARNRDGVYSKNITKIWIVIAPPFWLRWWAICLYIVFAATVSYAFYRNRIQSLKRLQERQVKALVQVQEEERRRISRDLHDDVGTKLSALKLFLTAWHQKTTGPDKPELTTLADSSKQFIDEAMHDLRRLLLNLSPAILEEFGLAAAVENLVNKINISGQHKMTLNLFGIKGRLQKHTELALYRITQELINNVLKHAEAKNVTLQIGYRDNKIMIMIEDDGKGFDVQAHKDGYGIQNLYARTQLMHGTVTIESVIGQGTSVCVETPYDANDFINDKM